MSRRGGKLNGLAAFALLAIVALLVSACGPEMATVTPSGDTGATPGVTPAATQVTQATAGPAPVTAGPLPVDPNDWHALGPADAAVTIVEYSDFQ